MSPNGGRTGVEASLAEIGEAMDGIDTEPLMVELSGKPIAYLQSYDPHLEDDHPYRDQPFGTLGIDLSIGPAELVGIGHGSAIVRTLQTEAAEKQIPIRLQVIKANEGAQRLYLRLGFKPTGETSTHRLMLWEPTAGES